MKMFRFKFDQYHTKNEDFDFFEVRTGGGPHSKFKSQLSLQNISNVVLQISAKNAPYMKNFNFLRGGGGG